MPDRLNRFDDNQWHKLVVKRESREVRSHIGMLQNSIGSITYRLTVPCHVGMIQALIESEINHFSMVACHDKRQYMALFCLHASCVHSAFGTIMCREQCNLPNSMKKAMFSVGHSKYLGMASSCMNRNYPLPVDRY
jgi:hypothetical protein